MGESGWQQNTKEWVTVELSVGRPRLGREVLFEKLIMVLSPPSMNDLIHP